MTGSAQSGWWCPALWISVFTCLPHLTPMQSGWWCPAFRVSFLTGSLHLSPAFQMSLFTCLPAYVSSSVASGVRLSVSLRLSPSLSVSCCLSLSLSLSLSLFVFIPQTVYCSGSPFCLLVVVSGSLDVSLYLFPTAEICWVSISRSKGVVSRFFPPWRSGRSRVPGTLEPCLPLVSHLCATCVPLVCHLSATCLPLVCHLSLPCLPLVFHLSALVSRLSATCLPQNNTEYQFCGRAKSAAARKDHLAACKVISFESQTL